MVIKKTRIGWNFYLSEFTGTVSDYALNFESNPLNYYLKIRDDLQSNYGISYQIFKKEVVFNIEHIKRIVEKLILAFETQSNISSDITMEFLVYLANSRQIHEAIKQTGVNFPHDRLKKMNFNEILFGKEENLIDAIKYLRNQTGANCSSDFSPLPEENWEKFLIDREIFPDQLINIVKSYNIHTPEEFEETPEISYQNIFNEIPQDVVSKAIVDALTRSMAELYINNYKKG